MSGRRRAVILAAAGAMTLTTAVAAAAATSPSAAHAASSISQTAKSAKTDATVDAMTSGVAATDLNLEKARAAAVSAAQQKVAQQRAADRAHSIYLNRQAKEKAAASERAHAIYLNRLAQQQAARQAAAEQAAAQKTAAQKAAQQQATTQAQSTSTSASASASSSTSTSSSSSSSSTSYSGSPQTIAQEMLSSYGWSGQFSCLDELWQKESDWSVTASNAGSGAYGIPQALPGSKMASAGSDWQTDAATQIKWGLEYIQSTYGSPCAAWSHETADGWY